MLSWLPQEWRSPVEKAQRLGIFKRREVSAIGLISIAAIVLEAFGIGMMLPLLQYVEHRGDINALTAQSKLWRYLTEAMSLAGLEVSLPTLSVLIFVLLLARQIVVAIRTLMMEAARARAAQMLVEKCFTTTLRARGEYIQNVGSGNFSLVTVSQTDLAASVIRHLSEVFSNLLTLGGYVAIMALIAFIPMLVAMVVGATLMKSVAWLVRLMRKTSSSIVKEKAQFAQFLAERLSAWRLIKISNSLPLESQLTHEITSRLMALDIRFNRITQLSTFIVTIGQSLMVLLVVNVAVDYLAIDLATVTLLFLALFRLMPVVTRLTEMRQTNAAIDSFLSQIVNLVAAAEAAREIETGQRVLTGVNKTIVYDNVCFKYQTSDRLVLDGVNLVIPIGKMTAITGPSGAGKSTLVDLLPHLIVPNNGVVRIDDASIADYTIESLRSAFHYVGQTPLFLNGSVTDNVRYARPDGTQEEVVAACKMAHADEFIRLMPEGYQTEIGEAGVRLSGGQRQRLAIARAFMSRARVIILDEPTSSLDHESETMVSEALRTLVNQHGATIIIIAHKASTVRKADFIAIMEAGRVVAVGTPAEITSGDARLARFLSDDTSFSNNLTVAVGATAQPQ